MSEQAQGAGLVWRKEPPTQSGYFWVRRYQPPLTYTFVAWVGWVELAFKGGEPPYNGYAAVSMNGIESLHKFHADWWAGPIPEPAEPAP